MFPGGYSCYNMDGSKNYLYMVLHPSDCSYAWQSNYLPPPASAMVSKPASPTGSVLTVPPMGGSDATSTVNQMIAQGMQNQQNAASSFFDSIVTTDASGNPTIPWYMVILIAVAGIGLIQMIGSSSGRRRK